MKSRILRIIVNSPLHLENTHFFFKSATLYSCSLFRCEISRISRKICRYATTGEISLGLTNISRPSSKISVLYPSSHVDKFILTNSHWVFLNICRSKINFSTIQFPLKNFLKKNFFKKKIYIYIYT